MNKKLRMYYIRNPPSEPTYFNVKSLDEAKEKIDTLAKADLKDNGIGSNVFGLEEFVDGEWSEYYNDDGMDITEIMEEMEE